MEMIMRVLGAYLIIINIAAFIMYGIDKHKAIKGRWRLSEATLVVIAALGGALGAFLGMIIWHHKTKKWKFRILVPLFLIIWIAIAISWPVQKETDKFISYKKGGLLCYWILSDKSMH